jgi:aspartate carbamoyltransferase catalytic subunit
MFERNAINKSFTKERRIMGKTMGVGRKRSSAAHLPLGERGDGRFYGQHILSVSQFARTDLEYVFAVAEEMRTMVERVGTFDLLKGKILASLFYEPSTRTSSSFTAAMERLGGSVIPINEVKYSSVAKGESLPDTIRTLECYSDVIVLRHPETGSAALAAQYARKPIINAGDGIGEHPTQALLDLFTIREELGAIDGLTITMLGDLKYGRTVHSLARLLSLYSVSIRYVSPEILRMPKEIINELPRTMLQTEHSTFDTVLPQSDVLYVTRVQKERFTDEAEYDSVKGAYVITPETMKTAKEQMIVMHPLPRVGEISPEFDDDPRAAYFRQMEYGLYVRMALLAMVLGKA